MNKDCAYTKQILGGCVKERKSRDIVSAEYLRSRVSYDEHSGLMTWKYCDSVPKNWNTKYAGKQAGFIDKNGYVIINILNVAMKGHRVAWAVHYGEWPDGEIDHIDLNKSNNRISNLRIATPSMNHGNLPTFVTNKSGYKGVCFDKRTGLWEVKIKVNKVSRRVGFFSDKHEAARAYNEAAIEGFGEYARVNIIKEGENA